jgi:hypothetical protein
MPQDTEHLVVLSSYLLDTTLVDQAMTLVFLGKALDRVVFMLVSALIEKPT